MLKIIPLGGLGEIGLNMMVFEYDDTIIIVDAGLMFPEEYMLGIDYVIPDMEYIKLNRKKVAAVILTHAHEDHIGALPFLLKDINTTVYGTLFTLEIVRHKLMEIDTNFEVTFKTIAPRDSVKVGPFDVEFIRVSHSVVDCVGLAISTPVGVVIHTADFKIGFDAIEKNITDISRFAQYGEKGVLALLSDSTNVLKEGYTISDSVIGETFKKIAKKSTGRIIVAIFASNIARIQQIVKIAETMGKKLVIHGRSVELSVNIAKELGYLYIPYGMEIDIEEIHRFRDDEIIMITTGTQGEPMSALSRMASGSHKYIKIKSNDTVILSSKFIPGNEKAIANIINNLYRQGADVIYEKISDIHVSGHAFQEELKLMLNITNPRFFVPIHGEYRHLIYHSRIAEKVGIDKSRIILAENGQIICFDHYGGRIEGSVNTGRILIDGKGVGDIGRSVLKERRALSEDGLVAVTIAFDEETGVIVYGPEILSKGFVFETESGHLLEDAKCVVLEIVEDIPNEAGERLDKIRSGIQMALRQYFNFTIKRRPIILPFILEV